jgi:hypothetical protein
MVKSGSHPGGLIYLLVTDGFWSQSDLREHHQHHSLTDGDERRFFLRVLILGMTDGPGSISFSSARRSRWYPPH